MKGLRSYPLLWMALGLLLASIVGACSLRPLLYDVSVTPTTISPNADGDTDVTRIEYKLARNATLSIYLVDEAGQQFYFRRERPRSRTLGGQAHRIDFGGVTPNEVEDLRQDRVLPDGTYRMVLEAIDERGHSMQVGVPLIIANADTDPPVISNLRLDRHAFSPNLDGVDDLVSMSFHLTKQASVSVFLLSGEQRIPVTGEPYTEPLSGGEGVFYRYEYPANMQETKAEPPPDGTYTVAVYAEDRVGNKVTVTDTLAIRDGGVPRATIVGLEWAISDVVVPIGGTLRFTATVENYGVTPIRTIGPESGTLLSTDWDEGTTGYAEDTGAFRFGLGFQDSPLGDYPWRWSLGRYSELTAVQHGEETLYYLMPGQRVLVTGAIQISHALPRNATPLWAGLIHEGIGIVDPRTDAKWITVDVEPTGPWGALATPTPMAGAE